MRLNLDVRCSAGPGGCSGLEAEMDLPAPAGGC